MLVEVVDDDADEEVEGEEGAEDDENDEVEVHVQVDFILGLVFQLEQRRKTLKCDGLSFLLPFARLSGGTLTPRESTAAYMMSIQPLNVA